MDIFQSHARKQQHLKYHKKRLSEEQIRLLETSFNLNNKLDPDRKSQLAQELGLTPRKVAIWYQNKRARWKNQSLEVNHKSLQVRLEGLVEDNEKLRIEVERLKQELQKAQEILLSINSYNYNYNTTYSNSISSSCDEVGSSISLLRGGSKNDGAGLDKEDLFACLIGTTNNGGRDFFPHPSIS
ncbi:hypothetical protein M9H77_25988 [Catharanthus roseus]|uniref:Uncharacterized protein n=1 Tax=Catharanthus roseus TaxID=4058 RepID=A0ACC0A9X4_CATRO|nr:hypothetical protein M9H77_25988 [Catharanthus roseus]